MKSFRKITAILAVGVAMLATSAQAQLSVSIDTATGDFKGGSTYSKMFRQFEQACPALGLKERETTGSSENIDLLTGNKVKIAWVQSDLLFYTKMKDPERVSNIRALFPLYNEELHFIARAATKTVGKFAAIGIGDKVELSHLSDLKGKKVGAVGGSVGSALIVNAKTGLNMQIQTYAKNQDLLDALTSGKVDAILVVGGQPHDMVKLLDTRFRIMEVDQGYMKALGDVYSAATVSYNNMGQIGVKTVATPALAVTRVYSQKMAERLKSVQQCFFDKLSDIQDSDSHEKWLKVNPKADMKWPAYDFSK